MYRNTNNISLSALREMEPFKFEHFVAELWSLYGWETVVSQKSGDMGIDIDAKRPPDDRRQSIQVKRYAADNKVGVGDVRQYASLDRQDSVNEAVIVTTSSFTQGAKRAGTELDVTLINGAELVEMIEDVEGGLDLVRKYLNDKAELTGGYRASAGAFYTGARPTWWWAGAVLGGISTLSVIPILITLQATGAIGGSGRALLGSVQVIAGIALGTVSVRKLEPALRDITRIPNPLRTIASSRMLAPGMLIIGSGFVFMSLAVGSRTGPSSIVDLSFLLGFISFGAYPIVVAGVYWWGRDELRANAATAEIESVSEAIPRLSNGGYEAVASARYLLHRSERRPDETVNAVSELVTVLDQPNAAEPAAAALANIAEEFPEQIIDELGTVAEAFDSAGTVRTKMSLAQVIGTLSRHDPVATKPTATTLIDRLSEADPEEQDAITPALPQFAVSYPDHLGSHIETIIEIALANRNERQSAEFAAEAISTLATVNPIVFRGVLEPITNALTMVPDRPGAESLYTALLSYVYTAANEPAPEADFAPDGSPDPWLCDTLNILMQELAVGQAPPRRHDVDVGSLSTTLPSGALDRCIKVGLDADREQVRLRTWALVCILVRTEPSLLTAETAVNTLKRGSSAERELAAIAIARVAAAAPEPATRYVPPLVTVLEGGTKPGTHGNIPGGVIDACLRALGSIARSNPAALTTHVQTIVPYLDTENETIAAAAATVIHMIAKQNPSRVSPYCESIEAVKTRDDRAGQVAIAITQQL